MAYWFGYCFSLIVGGGSLVALLSYLQRTRRPRLAVHLTLITLSLFLTLMALEFYLKNFFAEPDIVNTLAQQNWKRWYNEERLNSLGYRDVEWTADMVAGKIKVLVAGDSFVYGAGLARAEERFSDQLAQKLGPAYAVFNAGKNGLNTGQVIETILDYPYPPDVFIFSYYLNDIESISPPCRGTPRPLSPIPAGLRPLVENSHVVNFGYWRLARLIEATQPDLRWQCLFKAYQDADIWWLHQQELLSVYEGAKSEQIPLFVVVFPSLLYLDESSVATRQVVNLYRERDVPVVDVTELVKDLPPRQRVVSLLETHASAGVNKLVAEALYAEFVELNLVH